MSKESLDFLLGHLAFQQAFPTRVDFKVDTQFIQGTLLQSYTRLTWTTGEVLAADLEIQGQNGPQNISLMRFTVSTRTRLVRTADGRIPPDSEDPQEADVLMDASIDFMMEYIVQDAKPDEFDEAAITEFFGKQVPFNMWPYYREFLQSLALRARVPIPTIPPFRINRSNGQAQK